METSNFDPCLLISTQKDEFGLVGMQAADTIILVNDKFSAHEQNKLDKASFNANPRKFYRLII